MNQNQRRRSCEWIGGADSGQRIMDDPTPLVMREHSARSRGFAEQAKVEL